MNKKKKSKVPKKKFDYKSKDAKLNDEEKKELSEKITKHWNDAAWYIPDDNLRRIVGSISYQSTLGVPTELETAIYGPGGVSIAHHVSDFEPINVMSIETFSYPGSDVSVTGSPIQGGPLTVGMRKLFAAIATYTGRSQPYTPEDLGFAIMAVGDLVSAIAFAQRLIGIIYTYNPRNRGVPRTLVEAMGIQFDSLNENITRFRDSLNLLITSANNIRMLKDIKYFTKCWELYSHVYQDSESGMAQMYVTKPAGFLQLKETIDPDSGQVESELEFKQFAASGPVPYGTLLRRIEEMINVLLTSTTLKDVYNDILNYVSKQGGNLLGFSYVPELYSILPEYNVTFLNQVHNMDWGFTDLSSYKITGDPLNTSLEASDIFSFSGWDDRAELFTGDDILDMQFTDNPGPDDTIDACMFKRIIKDLMDNEGTITARAAAVPDHPVHKIKVWPASGSPFEMVNNCISTAAVAGNYLKLLPFRSLPIFYWTSLDDFSSYGSRRIPVAADLNYYTKIEYSKIKGIFDYAFLGLFDAEVKEVKPF